MTYEILVDPRNSKNILNNLSSAMFIPLDPANRHYQEVLDAIIEQGADCFDGDIPQELQAAADAKAAANSE